MQQKDYEELIGLYEQFVKEQERFAEFIEGQPDFANNIPKQSLAKFVRAQIEEFSHLRDGSWIDPDSEENASFDDLEDAFDEKELLPGGDEDAPPLEDDENEEFPTEPE